MILTADEVRSVTYGIQAFEERQDGFHFFRFSDAQTEIYRDNHDFYLKSTTSSGVMLDFLTDAREFSFSYKVSVGSRREYFYFDLLIDGVLCFHEGKNNLDEPTGRITLPLPEGIKRVTLCPPWSVQTVLSGLSLEGGEGIFEPNGRKRKILIFGDSITQGYDAEYPSLTYPDRLALSLDADAVNLGIGGEVFRPSVLIPSEWHPDLIVVAYGTNNWSHDNPVDFRSHAEAFFRKLTALYAGIPVVYILPIWREDEEKSLPAGDRASVGGMLREITGEYPDITVLDGYAMVPHLPAFYADLRLHPNDAGFLFYSEYLTEHIRQILNARGL